MDGRSGRTSRKRRSWRCRCAAASCSIVGRGDRELAGHEVEEQHADAVEIRLDRRGLSVENLGREIQGRTDNPRRAAIAEQLLAGAEVHEDDAAARFAHDVLRFDVAVQQAGGVDGGERGADVLPDHRPFARAERAARSSRSDRAIPLDQLHPEPDAIVVLLGAEHLHDVRVADAREPAGLLQDPIVSHPRGLAFFVEQFERDVPVEIGVERAIHLARHALTDPLEHDEAAPAAGRSARRPARVSSRSGMLR